jgi:hypothetical protein
MINWCDFIYFKDCIAPFFWRYEKYSNGIDCHVYDHDDKNAVMNIIQKMMRMQVIKIMALIKVIIVIE